VPGLGGRICRSNLSGSYFLAINQIWSSDGYVPSRFSCYNQTDPLPLERHKATASLANGAGG
jgi:hypothetical protein